MYIDAVTGRGQIAGLTAAAVRSWSVGQVLAATVIDRPDDSSIRLEIGGRVVTGRTTLPLPAGAEIRLRVASTGDRPRLVVEADAPPLPPATQVRRDALRALLPQQLPLPQALGRIEASARALVQHGAGPAEAPLLRALRDLAAAPPALAELRSAPRLAAAVARSGMQLEAELARQVERGGEPALPHGDLKWRALAVRAALDRMLPSPAPSPASPGPARGGGEAPIRASTPAAVPPPAADVIARLAQDTDALVARITTHQLQALPAEPGGALAATVELPVRLDERLEELALEIEREPAGGASGAPEDVAATIEIPLGSGAVLRARVALRGTRVDVALGADGAALRAELSLHHEELAERLRAAGLEVGAVSLRSVPPIAAHRRCPPGLVDEHA